MAHRPCLTIFLLLSLVAPVAAAAPSPVGAALNLVTWLTDDGTVCPECFPPVIIQCYPPYPVCPPAFRENRVDVAPGALDRLLP